MSNFIKRFLVLSLCVSLIVGNDAINVYAFETDNSQDITEVDDNVVVDDEEIIDEDVLLEEVISEEKLNAQYRLVFQSDVSTKTSKVTGYDAPITVTDLGELVIPTTEGGYPVTEIPPWVFRGETRFHGKLTLPNSLEIIGSSAFSGCSGLYGVLTIPYSVKEIGSGAFDRCRFTKVINNSSAILSLPEDEVWYDSDTEERITSIKNGTAVKKTGVESHSCSGGTASCISKAICTTCGLKYGELDPTNHVGETEIRNAKEAKCYALGYTGDTYCKSCNNKKSSGVSIDYTAHTPAEAVKENETAATCAKQGSFDEVVYCSLKECKAEISRTTKYTDKLDHTLTVSNNGDGTHSEKCSKCDYEGTKVTCHSETKATCISKAVCDECNTEYGEVDITNHVGETEIRNAKVANCHEKGYTGDTYCKSCNNMISEGEAIECTAHTPAEAVKENETAATCVKQGSFDEVVYCSVKECKAEISRTTKYTDKLEHTFSISNNGDGTHSEKCSKCDYEGTKITCHSETKATCISKAVCDECSTEYGEVDTTNHVGETEIRNAIAAKCYEEGYTGDTYCLSCDGKISEGTTIESTPHTPSEMVEENVIPSKCEEKGSYDEVVYCSVEECRAEISRNTIETDALGHIDEDGDMYCDRCSYEFFENGFWINAIADQTYTGKAINPMIEVFDINRKLVLNKDYTVKITNNVNVGTAAVTITGKGNYASTETANFVIKEADISDLSFTCDDIAIKAVSGKEQKPKPVLKWNGKAVATTGYTYSYFKADENGNPTGNPLPAVQFAGSYVVKINGKGNFTGTRYINLIVASDQKLVSGLTIAKIPNQTYTGEDILPVVSVKDGKTELKENTDYIVEYLDTVDVGTASVVVTGIGSYVGSRRINFKITGTPISKAVVSGIPLSVYYTGDDIEFDDAEVYIKATAKTPQIDLVKYKDYEVSYLKNKVAGIGTVVFTGINGYTGTKKVNFKISPFKYENDTKRINVSLESDSVVYSKGGSKPKVEVTFKKYDGTVIKLDEKIDYTVSYAYNNVVANATPAKLPTAKITLKGSYSGTIQKNFKITAKDIGEVTAVAADKVFANKAGAYKSAVKLTDTDGKVLAANKDYISAIEYSVIEDGQKKVLGPKDIVEAKEPDGTEVTVTITAKEGSNYTGSVTTTYRVTKAAISSAKVVKVEPQIYTGKAITLDEEDITIKPSAFAEPLVLGTDYEIVEGSYTNNTNKGTASVMIRGIGNYGGTRKVTFTIKAKNFIWWNR